MLVDRQVRPADTQADICVKASDGVVVRQIELLTAHLTHEETFGERRTVVRPGGLLGQDREVTGPAKGAELFARGQCSRAEADDDNPLWRR
jgi:hypothetical protein